MVEIKVKIDDAEITALIREEWYKKARTHTARILRDKAEDMIYKFMKDNDKEFKKMFAQALRDVLKLYTIKDLNQIKKILGKGSSHNQEEGK